MLKNRASGGETDEYAIMASTFYHAVWQAIASIPEGKVATFGLLAALAGNPRAARQAARAVSLAPEGLPCHRVVRAGGQLVPDHIFGPGVQHAMLYAEEVCFEPDGRVSIDHMLRLEEISTRYL